MKPRRFDDLTCWLGVRLPRRQLVRGWAAAAGFGATMARGEPLTAQESGTVGLECVPCNCDGDRCGCCIEGMTGGGLVRTASGDVTFVLFATLVADAAQEAAGFVRWLDPHAEGGLNMESVGPIAYEWPEGDDNFRNVRGIVTINGQEEQPFVLEVFDAGPDLVGQDTVRITVGASADASATTEFRYEAAGTIVGGDVQLLDTVAPVAPA